jgi:hypothetical protein
VTHREHVAEAKRRILELERERQRIEKELQAWTVIRDAYELLAKDGQVERLVADGIGFTESIRVVLGKHPEGLTPTALRDKLQQYGVACGSEKNFLGNIHAVLKRSKEIERVDVEGGRVFRLRNVGPGEATAVRRSRGASSSIDSGWVTGYGEIPGKS